MRIEVGALFYPIKGGVGVTALGIGLAACGEDTEAAALSLRHVVESWCSALRHGDHLDRALMDREIPAEDDGRSWITVDLIPQGDSM